jgi:hypothetical protein
MSIDKFVVIALALLFFGGMIWLVRRTNHQGPSKDHKTPFPATPEREVMNASANKQPKGSRKS